MCQLTEEAIPGLDESMMMITDYFTEVEELYAQIDLEVDS